MKLDAKNVRFLTPEDWRVLTAVEQGSRNHALVPTPLIASIAHLPSRSSITSHVSTLAKANLIARTRNARYDGYRLTYGGLDYLALHAHLKANLLFSVGNQIGVGKEADIIVVAAPPTSDDARAPQLVLKIHRLGRISFRTVKTNRDYLRNRAAGSWMYMSRLAAHKEYSFLAALHQHGFPVPRPAGWNRHTVLMELVDALPLRQIAEVPDPAALYGRLIELILRFAAVGLIHGDFNEFNILVKENVPASSDPSVQVTLTPIVIDFPQALSISHANAPFYFERDVKCIKRFFERRFHFVSDEPGPFFDDAIKAANRPGATRLDVLVEASGFSRKMAGELEGYMREVGVDGDAREGGEGLQGSGMEQSDEKQSDDDDDGEDGVLHEQPLDALLVEDEKQSASLPPVITALETVTLEDVRAHKSTSDDLVSVAGTARSRRPPPNPAKAARGWAI